MKTKVCYAFITSALLLLGAKAGELSEDEIYAARLAAVERKAKAEQSPVARDTKTYEQREQEWYRAHHEEALRRESPDSRAAREKLEQEAAERAAAAEKEAQDARVRAEKDAQDAKARAEKDAQDAKARAEKDAKARAEKIARQAKIEAMKARIKKVFTARREAARVTDKHGFKPDAELQKICDALTRLNSAVQIGLKIDDYSSMVRSLQGDADVAFARSADDAAKGPIQVALACYVVGLDAWKHENFEADLEQQKYLGAIERGDKIGQMLILSERIKNAEHPKPSKVQEEWVNAQQWTDKAITYVNAPPDERKVIDEEEEALARAEHSIE